MAHYICCATGNLTSAATWRTVDTTAKVTEGGTNGTTLSTTSQGTGAFAPGAITVDAIALKVLTRADGTPTNTMTIELYDATSSSSVVSITVPVADLPRSQNAAYKRGGWRLFSLGGDYALSAGKNYLIRLSVSNTSTSVSVMNNGTAANWQHMLRTTTTGAPGANDFMWILGLWTASATWTQYTVTMDQTTTSVQYGTGSTVTTPSERSGISVGKSTLTWPTASNTALSLCGFLAALQEGTINIGTSASPVTRGYATTVSFPVASGFGIAQHTDSTITIAGESSTASITRIWTTLVEDKSTSSTGSLVVSDANLGWTSGSSIFLSTSKAALTSNGVALTMSGDATTNSLPFSGSLSAYYWGSTGSYPYPSLVALTSGFNVTITSDATNRYAIIQGSTDDFASSTGSLQISWVKLQRTTFIYTDTFLGDMDIHHVLHDFVGLTLASSYFGNFDGTWSGTWSLHDIVGISSNNVNHWQFGASAASTCSGISVEDILSICNGQGGGILIDFANWGAMRKMHIRNGSFIFAYVTGANTVPVDLLSGSTAIGMYAASGVLQFGNTYVPPMTITNGAFVGGTNSVYPSNHYAQNLKFVNCDLHANSIIVTSGFDHQWHATFDRCRMGGLKESGQTPTYLMAVVANQVRPYRVNFLGCEFSGSHTTQVSSGIINAPGAGDPTDSGVWECQLSVNPGGFTSLPRGLNTSASYFSSGSYVAALDFNAIGDHRVWKPFSMNGLAGTESPHIMTDSTIYRTAAPSEKMVPKTTASKLESSIKRFAVTSGSTASVGVYAYRDAAYDGNPARLIIKQHNGAGYTADTVAATMSTSTGVWENLTTTIAAVPRDCVLEVYVDCDGTTGSIYLDDWSAT